MVDIMKMKMMEKDNQSDKEEGEDKDDANDEP